MNRSQACFKAEQKPRSSVENHSKIKCRSTVRGKTKNMHAWVMTTLIIANSPPAHYRQKGSLSACAGKRGNSVYERCVKGIIPLVASVVALTVRWALGW